MPYCHCRVAAPPCKTKISNHELAMCFFDQMATSETKRYAGCRSLDADFRRALGSKPECLKQRTTCLLLNFQHNDPSVDLVNEINLH